MPDFKNSKEVLLNIKNKGINYESESIDYKQIFKFSKKKEKLELIKDIVAFANTDGGYIIFGVVDDDYTWIGLDSDSDLDWADDNKIDDALNGYIDKKVSFQIGKYEIDGDLYLLLTIDKIYGSPIVFNKDGEYERTIAENKTQKRHVFKKGDIYGRIKSRSIRVNDDKTFLTRRISNTAIVTNLNKYPKPYKKYVEREADFNDLFESLNNPNIRCAQINGLGGIGKTSFVRHFCDKIIENNSSIIFDVPVKYIVWITGKLNRFLPTGVIETIKESELSFDEMLEIFCDVLSIDILDKTNDELKEEILDKLSKYNALIVMDNMETITDERILQFTRSIPLNCKMIFTTRTDMSVTYRRIELNGFNLDQFNEYINHCIEEFAPRRKQQIINAVSPYLNDLMALIQGSPILLNMIMYKVCSGGSVEVIVNDLRKMKKNNTYYDSVMNFCFSSTFNNLSMLEKKILFVMSISDINNEEFSIDDLSYILKTDKSDINVSMMRLFASSFCGQNNQNYVCQPLIKVFCSNEFNKSKTLIDTDRISKKYYEWSKTKSQINSYEISLFNRAKAYDFERKNAFLKVRDLKQKYDAGYPYDDIKKEMTKLIDELPDYAYLYFSRAKIEEWAKDDSSIIRSDYQASIRLDKDNDYYLVEYAYYLSSSDVRDNESAIPLFKQAIKINGYPNYYFGLALSLTKYYQNKKEFSDYIDLILDCYSKSYFDDTNGRNGTYRNVRVADAHARFLRRIKRYDEALVVCEKGLKYSSRDLRLTTLYGLIRKDIDPNYVSETSINNMKQGIFSSIDTETAKKLLEITDVDS